MKTPDQKLTGGGRSNVFNLENITFREPTEEELNEKNPSDEWYKEKGPWIAACNIGFQMKKKRGAFEPSLILNILEEVYSGEVSFNDHDLKIMDDICGRVYSKYM